MRFLLLLLLVCAGISYKWPEVKQRLMTDQNYSLSAKLVARLNDEMPVTVLPGVAEFRKVELEGNVARFHLHAIGHTDIKHQNELDDAHVALRKLYCTKMQRFVEGGVAMEVVAHSAPQFEDIRTRAVQVRIEPSECSSR